MLLNLKHPMEERRAGVFLGTVDEINQSEYRVVVKVTDTSKKSSSEMHTDLQIHHREFKSPNSDIIINRELKHTKVMNFFDAKNTDQSFMLITYKPLVKTTYDFTRERKIKQAHFVGPFNERGRTSTRMDVLDSHSSYSTRFAPNGAIRWRTLCDFRC